MNKTVNINLGGMFFHIDEDAYQKMTKYFNAIKRSLNNSSGQDEIIKDIEMRIAELIAAKHTSDKQVISMQELDDVIAIMGQPEDYRLDNEEENIEKTSNTNYRNDSGRKKLYRDRENGMIGGVLAGLAHYFGIEKVWLRLIFLFLLFVFGFGILTYIILWIVIPEAVTTSEKLEMHGEPINLENIEKKVREGFDTVSDKIKNADYNKFSAQASKVGSSFGDFIISLLGVFAKFIGILLIFIGLVAIVGTIISLLTLTGPVFGDVPWQTYIAGSNPTYIPLWLLSILMFFAVGIPFFFLALLGFKLLIPSTRTIGSIAKYTLLAVWIIAITVLIATLVTFASSFSTEGRSIKKQTIMYNTADTLKIKFIHSDLYASSINDSGFEITQDSLNNDVIYNNDIDFEILQTDEKTAYIQIEKQAKGKNLTEARATAEKIKYNFKLIGNQLILDNYLTTELKNKFRSQEVIIKLYLPKGTLFKADQNVANYDSSDNEYFNLHYSSENYTYRVDKNKVKCLDCPANENEYNDIDNEVITEDLSELSNGDSIKTVSVKVNGKEIIKTETSQKGAKLEINENGIITKKQ